MRKEKIIHVVTLLATVLASVWAGGVAAQNSPAGQPAGAFTMTEAAQLAVLKNPEVQARWHAFREAEDEVDVGRGGFFPKLDLSAGYGHDKKKQHRVDIDDSYHGNEATLTLRQMLFDGFATSNEVKRLGKAKLVRYFELLDASENAALEASRAYLDIIRYREIVDLAEENYLQHYTAHEQLQRRAASGVGKRVDVNQAGSRLALADVNLTTAYANLHDVSARYLRIVGEEPPKTLGTPERVTKALPDNVEKALDVGLNQNPALRASIENIEAAQYDLEGRRAAFMPRLDLVARRDNYSNYEDNGSRDDTRVELRLNYNLFNGGSDIARMRQYRERKDIALDQREKACRDMRQTLSIAYNDTQRLNDQLSHLATQVELVRKTRAAYLDQFNLGQRTLLDLLNTQNEYFDARRAHVNADVDLSLAYLRSYAGMGRLLEVLGLKHIELEKAPSSSDFAAVDPQQMCPPLEPVDTTLNRQALMRKAREMADKAVGPLGTRPRNAAPEETLSR